MRKLCSFFFFEGKVAYNFSLEINVEIQKSITLKTWGLAKKVAERVVFLSSTLITFIYLVWDKSGRL